MEKKANLKPYERTACRAFRNYAPPKDMTVSQWAEQNRTLSRESSAEAGPWKNDRTPYLTAIMDAFTDYRVNEISVMASSQIGKSELELNIIGYIIDQDPGSILYIHPNLDDAKKFSRLRVAPMIRDCPAIKDKVADVKSRDSGNTVLQKSFRGGMLTMVGSNSASGLASTPVRYVIGDERDRWAPSAGTEGDPWELAKARTNTFYNAKLIDVSTPTVKNASAIERSYDAGTQEIWCHECPECGEWRRIEFDHIKFDFETVKDGRKKDYIIKSVHWICPSCGCLVSENAMRKRPARWIAQNPKALERGHRSFWLNGFSSPWQSWEKIIYRFLKAKDDPKRLQVVFNTMFGQLWEDRGELPEDDDMLARREDYGRRPDGGRVDLPDNVLVLTCGVDTQDNRLEYEVVGHGHYGETWGIKRGIIMGDPHYPQVWERLDDVVDKVYRFADAERRLKISMTFVDSGGHKTQDVYRECAKRLNKRVFAIKGQGGDGIPYTKPPSKVKIIVDGKAVGRAWLYTLGVDAGKADIMNNIKAQEAGAKFCHFPRDESLGYDAAFFHGLISEQLILKTERGRTRWAWVKLPGHERNEALDCRNYALAAFRVLDPDLEAVERRLRGEDKGAVKPKPQRKKPRSNKNSFDEW